MSSVASAVTRFLSDRETFVRSLAPFGVAVLGTMVIAPSTALGGWTEQISNSQRPLMVVHAISSDVAWAAGDAGQVIVTVDGGQNWVSRPVVAAGNLYALFAFDGESSVVADWTGDFWRTTNGGLDWLQVHSGAGAPLMEYNPCEGSSTAELPRRRTAHSRRQSCRGFQDRNAAANPQRGDPDHCLLRRESPVYDQ